MIEAMIPRCCSLLSLLLVAGLLGCSDTVAPDAADQAERDAPPVITLTAQQQRLIEADNAFGLDLFRMLSEAAPDTNVFASPLSVSMALGMTLNGADGETRAEMERTLRLAGLSPDEINASYHTLIDLLTTLDDDVRFEIANSIWYRDTFSVEQAFLDLNTAHFDAAVQALDFDGPEAPNRINAWVDEKTHGKISQIVDGPIDPQTVMYLINAVYFNGDWTHPFDEEMTRDDAFTQADGTTTPVRMMAMYDASFPYLAHDAFQAVDLPYGDSLFTMTIFLPREGVSIDDFVDTLDADDWNAWTAALSPTKLTSLQLPKFKLEYKTSLKDALSALGMEAAFQPGRADFSGINPNQRDLHISDVLHKTFVEVDEEGTEAAAVTSVVVGVTSIGPDPITMRIDRPFVFAIREQATGTILFIGKVKHL